jgi:hypothetical protein
MKTFLGLICIPVLLICSCRPPGFEIGGGGSVHHPPEKIIVNQPTKLAIELVVWGEGSGKMSERWKDVKCHYRVGPNDWAAIDMTVESEQKEKITFVCTIPPQQKAGVKLEYYFDMLFDGHYNKESSHFVPIVLDANSVQSQ